MMIAGRCLPTMAVPVAGLSDRILGKILGATPIPRSSEVFGEASADVTEELTETRVNDDRFAVRSDSTNGNTALYAVDYL
jgi:hypothetical protein